MKVTRKTTITLVDNSTGIISHDKIRHDLEELIFAVHSAFEDTPRLAKQFFEDQKRKVDPFLINDLIRYYIKRHLVSLQFDVTENYDVDDLPNNGLSVTYSGHRVRILKAERGDLPVPHSDTKIDFYNQQLSLDSLVDDDGNLRQPALRPNVLILWELTNNYDFNQLYLACPKTGGKKRKSVTAYFNEAIEHPVYSLKPEGQAVEMTQEDEIDVARTEIKETQQYEHGEIDDIRRKDKTGSGNL